MTPCSNYDDLGQTAAQFGRRLRLAKRGKLSETRANRILGSVKIGRRQPPARAIAQTTAKTLRLRLVGARCEADLRLAQPWQADGSRCECHRLGARSAAMTDSSGGLVSEGLGLSLKVVRPGPSSLGARLGRLPFQIAGPG